VNNTSVTPLTYDPGIFSCVVLGLIGVLIIMYCRLICRKLLPTNANKLSINLFALESPLLLRVTIATPYGLQEKYEEADEKESCFETNH
jgi:hypothetical protein